MNFDRSLIAHTQREKFFSVPRNYGSYSVNVLSKEGLVFLATVNYDYLGPDRIVGGNHSGLIWWPDDYKY